jgi:hypothetical protein
MENNELIEHQNELLQIDIDYPLFISRRSLKHLVESRKVELIRKHTEKEVLNRLFLAVDNIVRIYINSDKISLQENNRTVYTKYSIDRTQHSIRLVLEQVENRLEICSIHFQKSKKLPQG